MDIINEINSISNNQSTDIMILNSRVNQESQTTTSVNNYLIEHPEIDIYKLCKETINNANSNVSLELTKKNSLTETKSLNTGVIIGTQATTSTNNNYFAHAPKINTNKFAEEIVDSGNPNFLLELIEENSLTIKQVIKIIESLSTSASKGFFKKVIISKQWKILKIFNDSKDNKELLDFFTDLPESLSQPLFKEKCLDEENLLHILSKKNDLTILKHFLTSQFEKKLPESFIQSRRKDGSNFLHILCSKHLQNSKLLFEIITWIQNNFGTKMVMQLMKDTTNEGNNVVTVLSRYQNNEFLTETLQLLVLINQLDAKNILCHQNNNGQNTIQIIYEYNIRYLATVLRSIYDLFTHTDLFENLICVPNKDNDNLCHLMVKNSPYLFRDILQITELHQSLMEKIFLQLDSNDESVMDKMCVDFDCFTVIISGISKKHGLDVTKSLLYNGDTNESPVLLKILNMNEMPKAILYLQWVLKTFQQNFTFGWIRKKNKHNFLLNIHLDSDEKYLGLCRWSIESMNKNLSETIAEDQSEVNWVSFHYYSVYVDDTVLIKFLKEIFTKYEKNIVQKFMLYQENSSTFLHLLCRYNKKITIEQLTELLIDNLDQNVVRELLLSKDIEDSTFLHILCWYNNKTSFEKLFELLLEKLDQNVVRELLLSTHLDYLTFLHILCQYNDKTSFKELFELLFDKLDQNVVREILLKHSRGWTFLHFLCRRNDKTPFKELLELLFEKLDKNDVKELLLSKYLDNMTFLHILCQYNDKTPFKELLELLFEKLDKNGVKELLLSKDFDNRTFLHILCQYNDKTPFNELLELLFEKLDKNGVKELLLSKDSDNWTFLHFLCSFNNKISFNELLELLLEKLDQNDNKELLLSKDSYDWTFLHDLCSYNDKTSFKELLELLHEKLDQIDVEQLLLSKGRDNWTLLHIMCNKNNKTFIKEFLELLFERFDKNSVKELLLSKNTDNMTFLHLLCQNKDKTSFKELFKLLFEKLDQNYVKELLLSKSSNGWTFLHSMCRYYDKTPFKELLELLFEKLDQNSVKELLLSKNSNGWTFLHVLWLLNAKTILFKELLELLVEKLDQNKAEELLLSKATDNWTFLQFLCQLNDKTPFKELFELLFEKLNPSDVKELLHSKSSNGRIFLHVICRNNVKIPFKELLELLLKKIDQNDIKELILSKATDNWTFLHFLCQNKDKTSFKEFLELLLVNYGQNVAGELLLSK